MTCGISIVDEILTRSFFRLGIIVGKNPGYFIVIPVLLSVIFITGFQRVNYIMDPEYLFSPSNGEGKYEREVVEEFFKVNYTSRFNVGRITRAGRFGRVIVEAKDGTRHMLRAAIFKELRLLDEIIQNITVYYDEEYFKFSDICARWNDQCYLNDILNLDLIIDDIEKGELNVTWPIMFNPVTWDAHAFPVYFGGTEVSEDNFVVEVPAVQLVYFVAADTKKQIDKGAAWEDEFLRIVGEVDESGLFEHISVARFGSRTLDHELERNTRAVVPYFTVTFLAVIVFSIITCMMTDWVRSKPWLGLLGNVSAIMAILAAFGATVYLGVPFIGINLASPFLMISIGIDDTFVMLAAWRRTNIKDSVPERLGHTLSEAAVSITITSVTDMVSFFIGGVSPFPSIRIFSIYSGFSVLFLFVWHLTFFTGCLAVAGYCEKKNLHALFCFKVSPASLSEKKSWFYRAFCSGGINPDDPDNPRDNREHGFMVFFRDYLASFINNGFVKFCIIVIFIGYLCVACYGVTQIREGLERRRVAKADSYSIEFFDREDEYYRDFPYRLQLIISGEHNYSDPLVQDRVEYLTQQLENTSYISSPIYTESWIRTFVQYMNRNLDYYNVTLDNEKDFLAALKEYWLYPSNPFSLDVAFDETGEKIIASRILIQAININDTNHEKEMVRALRNIVKQSSLNATIFHPYFVFFDQFELVRPISIQSLVVGAIVMMIISFIFIPNFLCGIWVAFSIISIEVGVVGYMALWHVNLDSISMINLIMCVGFSVDFTAHICYAYMSSKAKTTDQRVRESLYALGLPIFQGCISTIIGVGALLLTESYIFITFFKVTFLVIFFGALHGMFLLPVLLSLFGPSSSGDDDERELDVKLSKVQQAFPYPYCIPHPNLMIQNGNQKLRNDGKGLPPYKIYGKEMEKDLGLGTSGEDTSESSSNKSQMRQQELEDENTRRRYEEGWRRSAHSNMTQFQPSQMPDLYGYEAERAWFHQQVRERSGGTGYQNSVVKRNNSAIVGPNNGQYQIRKYTPPDNYYPSRRHVINRVPPRRSSSYHNISPNYVKDLRYP